jgi:hypothetical protein
MRVWSCLNSTSQDGAALSIAEQPELSGDDYLVPFPDAGRTLGRAPITLKRWYRKGWLPAIIIGGQWCTFASFLAMIFASPQPAKAARLEQIAEDWFAAHAPAEQEVAA